MCLYAAEPTLVIFVMSQVPWIQATALSVRHIHVPKWFSGMERWFWLICIYLGIKRIEWRFRSELVCVEPNDVYGTVSFELSDLSQTWQTVSQSAVWVAMCHQHTAPSARSLFNKDRLCFETLPLSVGFSPVFVLSPPLLSFPLLRTEEDVRCQNKNEMLEGTEEEKWSVCPLVGSGPNL